MTRGSVLKEAIDQARIQFLRHLREWERRAREYGAENAVEGDEDEEEEEEEEEELPRLQVEIARGVTQRMKDRIPADWLVGLAIDLLPDGVLVLIAVETNEHNDTRAYIGELLSHYARMNGLRTQYPFADTFDYNGHQNHPDGVLQLRHAHPRRLPILVVELAVKHRSTPQLIAIATEYLQRDCVQSVVGFKIFPACKRVYRNQPFRVRKPALAIVFERVPGQAAAPFAIQIAQEVSFGSARIHRTVRQTLSALPTRTLAADAMNPRAIPPSPYELIVLDPSNVRVSFGLMTPLTLVVRGPNYALVPGAAALPNVEFDLRHIFRKTLVGWTEDQ